MRVEISEGNTKKKGMYRISEKSFKISYYYDLINIVDIILCIYFKHDNTYIIYHTFIVEFLICKNIETL